MRNRIFPSGVVVAWALLLASGTAGCGSRPTARVVGVSFRDIGLKSLTLLFDVEVENRYSVPLPLVNLDYSLASRGESFLSGDADIQGEVPANGTKTVPLPAKVTFLELLKAVKGVRLGSVVPYEADLGLSVKAPLLGRLRLPLKKEGQMPVPTVPDVDVAEIKWDKLTLQEASGTIKLQLVNRNQFPMDLSRIAYSLSLGDVEVARSSLARGVSFAADGGAGDLEIPISLSAQQAGFGLLRMLTGSGSAYRFSGTIDVGTPFGPMSVPVEKVGKTLFRR